MKDIRIELSGKKLLARNKAEKIALIYAKKNGAGDTFAIVVTRWTYEKIVESGLADKLLFFDESEQNAKTSRISPTTAEDCLRSIKASWTKVQLPKSYNEYELKKNGTRSYNIEADVCKLLGYRHMAGFMQDTSAAYDHETGEELDWVKEEIADELEEEKNESGEKQITPDGWKYRLDQMGQKIPEGFRKGKVVYAKTYLEVKGRCGRNCKA